MVSYKPKRQLTKKERDISIVTSHGKKYFYIGKFDDFRLWSRVLTADEIYEIGSKVVAEFTSKIDYRFW